MVENEQWSQLLALDELNRENKAGRALYGFRALQPSFPPTFKRNRGIGIKKATQERGEVDSRLAIMSSKKVWQKGLNSKDPEKSFYNFKRMPSFTDRFTSSYLHIRS